MAGPKYSGQTDSTLKITLDPFLLQVSFTSHIVATGGSVGVEAHTLNVADGAKIELTFLDGQGANVGTSKGQIFSGVHRSLFKVEKANQTGHMMVIAELPDYGQKLAGTACKVLPPVLIENLKWMDAEGSKEIETVVRGQKVTLVADVTLGPMEDQMDLDIRAAVQNAGAHPAGDGAHAHSHEPAPEHFKYRGKIKSKKISEVLTANWDVPARKAQLDYTINLYGVVSKPSKKVGYVQQHGFSE